MPPIVIPTLVRYALGAAGAAVAAIWAAKQARRVNEELERVRNAGTVDPASREGLQTLRRDPRTGEWRLDS
jgi:hypothetical protein